MHFRGRWKPGFVGIDDEAVISGEGFVGWASGAKLGFGGGYFDAEGLGHLYPESGYMVTLLSGWGVGLSPAPPGGDTPLVTVGFVAGIFIAITLGSFQWTWVNQTAVPPLLIARWWYLRWRLLM